MSEDAAEVIVPEDSTLQGVALLVAKQIALEDLISTTEGHLATMKEDLKRVQLRELPEAMTAIPVTEWTDGEGNKISVQPFVRASITEAKKDDAHQWLRENAHGDLIKSLIAVDVGQNEALVKKLVPLLVKLGASYSAKEAVHSGTLKAWVKEQIAAGVPIPLELFGVFTGQKSTIKRGK